MKRLSLAGFSSANVLLLAMYQLLVLYFLGINRAADVYFASLAIPAFLGALVYAVFTFSVLPQLSRRSEPERRYYVGSLLGMLGLVLAILFFLVGMLNFWLGHYLFPGFFPAHGELYLELSSLQFVAGFLTAASHLLAIAAQAAERYSLVEAVQASITGAGILALATMGSDVNPGQVVVLDIVRALLVLGTLMLGLHVLPRFQLKFSELVALFLGGARSLLLGNVFLKALPVLDRSLSSMAAAGELTLLHFVQQLAMGVQRVFSKSVAVPALVSMSRDEAGVERWRQYRHSGRIGLLAGTLAYGLLVSTVVAILYWRSPAGGESMLTVLLFALLAAAGLFVAGLCGQVSAGYFYSSGDTRTPMLVSSASALVSLALRIALVVHYGIVGLLLGASMHQLLNMVVLDRLAWRRQALNHV